MTISALPKTRPRAPITWFLARYTRVSVKSSVEDLEDNKVKLSVEVEPDEIEVAVSAAYKRIAQQVNLPGFRKGKVPRKVLEARLGKGYARAEALNDALPGYYQRAIIENGVDAIASPEIDITDGEEDGPLLFDAVVEVRPQVNVAGYNGLKIEVPSLAVTDEDVASQIDALRGQFAEQVAVERPAAEGDFVVMNISATYEDEPVEGLTAEDYTYNVGSGFVVGELDENLVGAEAGATLTFDGDHPDPDEDGQLSFTVEVLEVKEKQLPELTDEWAAEASEFATVAELTEDTTTRIANGKLQQTRAAVQNKTAEALAQLVDDELPEGLVSEQMDNRLQELAMQLGQSGIQFDQYMQMTGQTQEDMLEQMREPAEEGARVDLALRAVAVAEGMEVTEEDLQAEFDGTATQLGQDGATVRAMFEANGTIHAVKADILKRQAMLWLLDHVEIADEDGNTLTWEELVEDEEEDTEEPATEEAAAADTDGEEE